MMMSAPEWGPRPADGSGRTGTSKRRPRRVFLWIFLAVQLLFLIWVIMGASSGAGTPEDCGNLSLQDCNDAESVGTAIGVGLIIALWAAADVILGITYLIYRVSRRPRP